MISIKDGAKIEGIRPEILLGVLIVSRVLENYTIETVITEGTGGTHTVGSLHYKGEAVDIRSKDISDNLMKGTILEECKARLGKNFDMIIEDEGKDNEHFHLEFQPKD